MIPGPPDVLTCPACGAKHYRKNLISGNTIGATYFSDGVMNAPMLPKIPVFTKCYSCNALFKVTKEIVSKGGKEWDFLVPNANTHFVRFLAIDDYIRAIDEGLCNSEPRGSKEFNADTLQLRLRLWRAFNDNLCRRGRGNNVEAITDQRYLDNCRAILSEITEDGASDPELLTLAEIHRNLGEFDECLRLLFWVADKDRFKHYISAFQEQCAAHNKKTFDVTEPHSKMEQYAAQTEAAKREEAARAF